MTRDQRLRAARHWLQSSTENVIKRYARWFGVDPICAIKELELLGVELDERIDWDDDFEHIAGLTSGGAPFGVPW